MLLLKYNIKKDLEMTKFVMKCIFGYAGLIEYLIVFDMPFLFNGIILKS